MNIFVLLTGIVIAAAVFSALLWSMVQIARQTGKLRWAHLAALLGTLAAMSALSLGYPGLIRLAGMFLTFAGAWAFFREDGWNRSMPFFQLAFGLALAMGLPFMVG